MRKRARSGRRFISSQNGDLSAFLAVAFIKSNISDKKQWDTCKDVQPGFMSTAWAGRKSLQIVRFCFTTNPGNSKLSREKNNDNNFFHQSLTTNFSIPIKDSTLCSHCGRLLLLLFFIIYFLFNLCWFCKKSSNFSQVTISDVQCFWDSVMLLFFCCSVFNTG